eukprot:TRINITY_DN20020_c0_g1_i4.p1 TRINITY_DN20020_c0_g1~~TRINITY_DN20020_c0_g1_i4.p1  ORF type:complete len:2497 (+),score=567.91 TRINITY_DN20020_c0_g1_i4:1495-8985(+)
MLDLGTKRFFFIKIIRVDKVVTPPGDSRNTVDTYITVTYDGMVKRTQVVLNDITPCYNCELVFELKTGKAVGSEEAGLQDNKQVWEEIEHKGPVFIDLWSEGEICMDHLGRASSFVGEILEDERGEPRPHNTKHAMDRTMNTKQAFDCRVFKGSKRFSFTWGEGEPSNIFFEMWFLPDFSSRAKIRPLPPPQSFKLNGIEERYEAWDRVTEELIEDGRSFPCKATDHFGRPDVFLPRFVDKIKPPHGIDNYRKVEHYISCIPYMDPPEEHMASKVSAPSFFSLTRQGDVLDHALLHCSFLLGMGLRAYVCIGTTLLRVPHAWVITFEDEDYTVKIWEPFLATGEHVLKDRFAHPEFLLPSASGKLTDEAAEGEVRRRKRMRIQRTHQLTMRSPKVHEHLLVYGDRSKMIWEGVQCDYCSAVADRKAFLRGFYCELDEMHFDPRERHDFVDYENDEDAEMSEPLLPYRTIEVVFNNKNIWANLQNSDPRHIFYDLWNPTYWHPFAPKIKGIKPCFLSFVFPASNRDAKWVEDKKAEIHARLTEEVRERRAHANLPASFVKNPNFKAFLEAGLEMHADMEMCDEDEKEEYEEMVEEWHTVFNTRTPPKHRMRLMMLHFNFMSPDMVAEMACDACQFITSRESVALFALAVHVLPLPGDIVSVFIYICQLTKLGETEVSELREGRKTRRTRVTAKSEKGPTAGRSSTGKRTVQIASCLMEHSLDGPLHKIAKDLRRAKAMMHAMKANGMWNMKSGVSSPFMQAPEDVPESEQPEEPPEEPVAVLVEETRDRKLPMSAFDDGSHSEYVELIDDGLVARYVGSKQEGQYVYTGVVFGDGQLESSDEGKYFEVTILEVTADSPDGLTLGVTTSNPDVMAEMAVPPETIEGLRNTWAAGFYGAFWDGGVGPEGEVRPVDWQPNNLVAGDKVGFLVEPSGYCVVFVNGEAVLAQGARVPYHKKLYAVVDLLGTCVAVELNLGATVPTQDAADDGPAFMEGFSTTKVGDHVAISKDTLTASFSVDRSGISLDDLPMGGIVFGNGPLMSDVDGDCYFEVTVERCRQGMLDGMAIGVTTKRPADFWRLPETSDMLDPVWMMGYDGHLFSSHAADPWLEIHFRPTTLQFGDRVGCLVTAEGQLLIFVNDVVQGESDAGIIPRDGKALYAVLDLLGGTDSVQLNVDARKPEPPSAEEQQAGLLQMPQMPTVAESFNLASFTPNFSPGFGFAAAAAAPQQEDNAVAEPEDEEDDFKIDDIVVPMAGFSTTVFGANVKLSEDGTSAEHIGRSSGDDLSGGIISDGPLRHYEAGWYFEVLLDRIHEGPEDGLVIGVTTLAPQEFEGAMPETVDEVEPCWLVGYDGTSWDGGSNHWAPVLWNPMHLVVGDAIGALVTEKGELRIFVNGTGVCKAPFSVPTDKPFYGLVDLVGTAEAVTLNLLGAPPLTTSVAKAFRRKPVKLEANPFQENLEVLPMQADAFEDMRAFSLTKYGRNVHLSPDGLRAEHIGHEGEMAGSLIGDGPVPITQQGLYFEVRVERVTTGHVDGMAIGVINKSPDQIGQMPEHMLDSIDNAWLMGMDGSMWDGANQSFEQISWNPKDLQEGDRVGIMVDAASGDMSIYVNGIWRDRGPTGLPCHKPLYAAIDLLGSTEAISYIPHAKFPSEECRIPAAAFQSLELSDRGFSRQALGKHVTLSPDGFMATRSGKVAAAEMGGTVVGARPIKFYPGQGYYFEIVLERVLDGRFPDGLAVGVTAKRPQEIRDMPSVADQLEHVWLAGYDGATWSSSDNDWGICDFDPGRLREGDVVGVLVDLQGTLSIFLNGGCFDADVLSGIPADETRPIFAVVDLLGSVNAVLLQDVPPPSKDAGKTKSTAQKAPQEREPMRGFYEELHGTALDLTSGCSGAFRLLPKDGGATSELDGVLIGDGPLQPDSQGRYDFQLGIEDVRAAGDSGMAIGFTTKVPWDMKRCPSTADQVDPSWLVGFDGAVWDGHALSWGISDFSTGCLAPGDVVKVQLNKEGTMKVSVNEQVRAKHKLTINTPDLTGKLFALVDLSGNTMGVALLSRLEASQHLASMTDATLSKFSSLHAGKHVRFSSRDKVAHYVGKDGTEGIVLSDGTLAAHPQGGVFYNVTVTAVQQESAPHSFCLGVTAVPPDQMQKVPEVAESLLPSWLAGFDGAVFDGVRGTWGLSQFMPQDLAPGDVITVRITKEGQMQLLVDGVVRGEHDLQIPLNRRLFAIADLSGIVAGLSIDVNAGSLAAADQHKKMSGFDETMKGANIKVHSQRRSANRLADDGQAMLVSDGVLLPWTEQGVVGYKLVIRSIKEGMNTDGLLLGVTTRSAAALRTAHKTPPATADVVKPSWLVGLDGAYFDSTKNAWDLSDFIPEQLKVGDVVNVLVYPSPMDSLVILVNGVRRASHVMSGLPEASNGVRRLFALIDLAGHVNGVSLDLDMQNTGALPAPAALKPAAVNGASNAISNELLESNSNAAAAGGSGKKKKMVFRTADGKQVKVSQGT